MPDSIWTAPLAALVERVSSLDPVPAGVSSAAVAAALGLALLTKVLEVVKKRKDFAGDRDLVASLLHESRNKSQILVQLADEDILAFREYLDCLRKKESTTAALRKAIEIPLNAAQASAAGIELCEKARGLAHAFVAPDLGTARELLSAAARSALLTVESNLEQLPENDAFRAEASAHARQLRSSLDG
jgi:formiminotetrahydrofolate cyclodeaminase